MNRNKNVLVVLGIFLAVFFGMGHNTDVFAAQNSLKPLKCGQSSSPVPWSYCIYGNPSSTSHDVIYYLHEHGGDAHSWEEIASQEYNDWANLGYSDPWVVGVSFGPSWSLAGKNGGTSSGLFDVYVKTIMPKMESLIGVPLKKRILFGFSMGGLNVLELALKKPLLFTKAVAGCPAFPDIPLYSSPSEISSYVARTGTVADSVNYMFQVLRKKFPTEKSWDAADPLEIGKTLFGPQTPRLFISTGTEDEFGLYPVSKELVSLAKSRGVQVESKWIRGGGHCAMDLDEAAQFIAQ